MVETYDTDAIRRSALKYQWMHNKDWTQMGEEGDPPVIVEGKGIRVTDSTGKTWIDASGGYYSIHVGYGREEIAYAAYEQMKRINFFPSGTTTAPVIQLCEKLAELTPGSLSRAYLNSGGSEANETAIKIAKAYHKRRGEHGRYKIISRRGSYHGTTAGVMWLGESSSNYGLTDFEPAYPGMLHAPSPNSYRPEVRGDTPSEIAINAALAIEDLILMHGPSTVAAVIGEPVAQPPGAVVPGDEYWPMVRDICDCLRRVVDRGRDYLRLRTHGDDVRYGPLGRRAGHHERRQRNQQQLSSIVGDSGKRGNRGLLRRRGQRFPDGGHRERPSRSRSRSAQEHRNHRRRKPGRALCSKRRLFQGPPGAA